MGRLTAEQHREKLIAIEALYREDPARTFADVARATDLSRSTVRRFYQELGLTKVERKERPELRKLSGEQERLLVQRYVAGDPIPQMRRDFSISNYQVFAILKRHKVTLRGRSGPMHHDWNGGRRTDPNGYILVWLPKGHPMRKADGYAFEHRLVMSEHLGRPLTKHETVHHINGDRADNRIENLQLRHGNHGKGIVRRCRCCGSTDIVEEEL